MFITTRRKMKLIGQGGTKPIPPPPPPPRPPPVRLERQQFKTGTKKPKLTDFAPPLVHLGADLWDNDLADGQLEVLQRIRRHLPPP